MSNIYHYCSLDTFAQIIKYKTIRLSDLNKTNDYMEKHWGMQFLYHALCEDLQANEISMDLKEDYWYSDEAHNHIEQLERDMKYFLNHDSLIACFSTKNDLLSQWRAYGNDGAGIAIGFDYDFLKKLLKYEEKFLIGEVVYKKEKQEKIIREKLFNPAINYIKEMYQHERVGCNDTYNEYFIDEFDSFCEKLYEYAEKVFSFLKNPAFEEEKEVRIVYNTGIYEEMEDEDFISYTCSAIPVGRRNELELLPLQYAVKDTKLVAYADLKFEKCVGKGIIKEIVIGPKAKAKVSISDIHRFLVINGFDTDILVSESKASYQ